MKNRADHDVQVTLRQDAAAATDRRPSPATARPVRVLILSCIAGIVLAIIWSADLVDGMIGRKISDGVLGQEAETMPLTGVTTALIFALVTGVAGALTACNIAVFSALAPLVGRQGGSAGSRVLAALRPLGWLTIGAVTVAGLYGAVGVYIDGVVPQLSTDTIGDLRLRSIQSAVVFGAIGAVLVWRGLVALRLVRDPLAQLFARRPNAEAVMMGGLIGGFVIGRPFGLFRHLYTYAGETDNPLIGFLSFALQSIGNILPLGILLVLLVLVGGGRLTRWLAARPTRIATISASAMIIAGAFFITYWDLKTGSRAGWYGWPTLPYQR